jgi:aspartate/methionine/tyrosine aminotransferase
MPNSNLKFSKAMKKVSPFRVMTVMDRASALEAQGEKVIHMEVGEPDFITAPPIVRAAKVAMDNGKTQYTLAPGIIELREKIASRYLQKYKVEINPDRILITPGASGGLTLLANMLVSPGDGILIPDPAYPCVRNFVHMLSAESQLIPVGLEQNFQPTLQQIIQYRKENTVGVWLASPSNPTGTILGKEEMVAISEWTRAKGLHLLVDEIYHGLQYVSDVPSILEICDNAFVVSSFSKYFGMTGWRLGWIIVPEDYIEMARILSQNLFISAPSISQFAALAAFTREAEEVFEKRRVAFEDRKSFLTSELVSLGFIIPEHIHGAFYVYADISKFSQDSELFCNSLLTQQKVAITPGTDFGQYRAKQHVRFAFTTSMENLSIGVERLKSTLK